MIGVFAQRYTSSLSPHSAPMGGESGGPHPPLHLQQQYTANAAVASSPGPGPCPYNMDARSLGQAAEHSFSMPGSSSFDGSGQAQTPKASVSTEKAPYLPPQVFSSPTDHPYPASTLAAVEATRARFFTRHAGGGTGSTPRSRPTPTGTTTLPMSASGLGRRTHKAHALSSASSCSYRQSFFERCQRAMNQSRAAHREQRVLALRKGTNAFTPGMFSDDMDIEDDDADSIPSSSSSSPTLSEEQAREEDDEMTRRRILAEYSRLKRIYELKGHLEIGWIDPDQLSWLENEVRQQEYAQQLQQQDPYWLANDDQLEQLYTDSLLVPPQHTLKSPSMSTMPIQKYHEQGEMQDDFYDPEFEEALAQLPI